MPRVVRIARDGPYRIEPQDKPIFVCGCGLSKNLPFCDGTHKRCREEINDKLYIYDDAREEVVEVRDLRNAPSED